VKNINILLLSAVLFFFTACEEKKTEEVKITPKESNQSSVAVKEKIDKAFTEKETYTFLLSDMQDQNHTFHIEHKRISLSNVEQKLILIHFFSTWCPPCQGEAPYLADLQKKYKKDLFILGLLVNDSPSKKELDTFRERYAVNYFISNTKENDAVSKLAVEKLQLPADHPLPLTILFKDGHYYSHYEGAVPVEMLEHDIKNASHKE